MAERKKLCQLSKTLVKISIDVSFNAECLAIAIHISDVGATVKIQYVIKSPQSLRNYLKPMKLNDKQFWIAWEVLLVVMVGCCISEGLSEDTAMLGGAYALSLLSAWVCHRVRARVAYGNLIAMVVYNAILAYNLVFNSRYGAGMTWWFYAVLLNTIHSIALLGYSFIIRCKYKLQSIINDGLTKHL